MEEQIEVYCGRCGKFYTAREGSRADKLELCSDCLVRLARFSRKQARFQRKQKKRRWDRQGLVK